MITQETNIIRLTLFLTGAFLTTRVTATSCPYRDANGEIVFNSECRDDYDMCCDRGSYFECCKSSSRDTSDGLYVVLAILGVIIGIPVALVCCLCFCLCIIKCWKCSHYLVRRARGGHSSDDTQPAVSQTLRISTDIRMIKEPPSGRCDDSTCDTESPPPYSSREAPPLADAPPSYYELDV